MPYIWTFSRNAEIIVSARVVTFGPHPSGKVVLNVLLRIIGYCRETIGLKKSHNSETRLTNDAVGTVAAMSRALSKLSGDIAATPRNAAAARGEQSR